MCTALPVVNAMENSGLKPAHVVLDKCSVIVDHSLMCLMMLDNIIYMHIQLEKI